MSAARCEIKGRFGAFQTTDARCRLFEKLETFLAEVRATGFVVAVIVNGSFATSKQDPTDIDLILVLTPTHDFSSILRPFENVARKIGELSESAMLRIRTISRHAHQMS